MVCLVVLRFHTMVSSWLEGRVTEGRTRRRVRGSDDKRYYLHTAHLLLLPSVNPKFTEINYNPTNEEKLKELLLDSHLKGPFLLFLCFSLSDQIPVAHCNIPAPPTAASPLLIWCDVGEARRRKEKETRRSSSVTRSGRHTRRRRRQGRRWRTR